MEKTNPKLIHAALMLAPKLGKVYLLLRKQDNQSFVWYQLDSQYNEAATSIAALSAEAAIRLARREWGGFSFRTLGCGYRYTLPERDEHGINALFHQMVASYSSPNGIYFDDELGNNCFVNYASQEARELWEKLKTLTTAKHDKTQTP